MEGSSRCVDVRLEVFKIHFSCMASACLFDIRVIRGERRDPLKGLDAFRGQFFSGSSLPRLGHR